MDNQLIISYFLAVLVGITLGLIGSGGSILTVPIMVYVVGLNPVLAGAYSLFVVGFSALIGGFKKLKEKLVDFKLVLFFGIPAVISVFVTRFYIVPIIPEIIFQNQTFLLSKSLFLMIFFGIIMIGAAIMMIKPIKSENNNHNLIKQNSFLIILLGIIIGFLAGLVGAGGGFLIIPALVIIAKTPMKTAIGTSLFIVAIQSLTGFLGDYLSGTTLDLPFLLTFTAFAVGGIFIGDYLSKKIDGAKLKTSFGWFVLFMGFYIVLKEIFFKSKN